MVNINSQCPPSATHGHNNCTAGGTVLVLFFHSYPYMKSSAPGYLGKGLFPLPFPPYIKNTNAAQIVMKVIHTFKFSCYNRHIIKAFPASVSNAPTRYAIDVQVHLVYQGGNPLNMVHYVSLFFVSIPRF